jgi:endonuclease/exonuclease/phosphatase family metal-dependent hydrolase
MSELKILSYNVHQKDLQSLRSNEALFLFFQKFDLVMLQEVVSDSAAMQPQEWNSFFPYYSSSREMRVSRTRFQFNWIASKYPLKSIACVDLTYRRRQERSALIVDADLSKNGRIRICNTHLGLRNHERDFQIRELQKTGLMKASRLILGGDFNDWNFRGDRHIRRSLGLCRLRSGFFSYLATFPSRFPLISLDRIYHSADLKVEYMDVSLQMYWRFSDHRPIACQVCL